MYRYVNGLKHLHGCADADSTVSMGARLRHMDALGTLPTDLAASNATSLPPKTGNISPRGFAVVESRQLVRDCLSMYLANAYGIPVDGCETVDEYLAATDDHTLVIMGAGLLQRQIMLGQLSKLCRECGQCPVILMLDGCDYALVSESLRNGARGVVPTSLSVDIAKEAISLVMAGGTYIPAESLVSEPAMVSRPARSSLLTAREEQVFALLKAGKQNKQIAYSLGLSEGTVKVHLHNMMKKLGTTNRTQTILAVAG